MEDFAIPSDASVNFLVCVAAIAFSFAGISSVYELFRAVVRRAQEFRYYRSILMIAAALTVSALLPLVLSRWPGSIWICCYTSFGLAMTVFGHILFEVATGRVAVQNKRVFVALGSITAAALLLLPVDAHYFRSMVVYKLVLLWTTVILGYRFYLFMKHVVRVTSEPPALLTAAQGPDRRDALTAPGPAGEIKSSAR